MKCIPKWIRGHCPLLNLCVEGALKIKGHNEGCGHKEGGHNYVRRE